MTVDAAPQSSPSVISPTPDGVDQYFWDGVAEKRLLLQKCAACDVLRQPPSPMCPECNSLEWNTIEACGRAKVYSWIQSQHPTDPGAPPRIIVVLDLEEGVRFVCNLVGIDLAAIHFGMNAELCWEEYPSMTQKPAQILPQFRPASDASKGNA